MERCICSYETAASLDDKYAGLKNYRQEEDDGLNSDERMSFNLILRTFGIEAGCSRETRIEESINLCLS